MEKLRILLVEDYDTIRNVYFFALTEDGFQVDTASSGAEALERVAKATYDLICLDMVMMQYSGLEFLQAFRAQQPQAKTKVVVLSNIDSAKIIERAKALGVDQYLVKSHYTPRQLVAVVRAELGLPPEAPAKSTARA
jgi:two-component system alkaline phosphatase synthesis response regulator PhoP